MELLKLGCAPLGLEGIRLDQEPVSKTGSRFISVEGSSPSPSAGLEEALVMVQRTARLASTQEIRVRIPRTDGTSEGPNAAVGEIGRPRLPVTEEITGSNPVGGACGALSLEGAVITWRPPVAGPRSNGP